jgi:V-type H+-transporting ATPase subunit a
LNIGLFSSCYEIPESLVGDKPVEIHATSGCVYPFGIDSIWKVAENQMQFTNSLKMKIAVIIGVTHMMLGLLVRFLNGIKKRDWLDVFSTTLPQTLFMLCTFVYMDYLIFLKWTMDYSGKKSAEAPSIISTMIAVFAGFGADGDVVFWERERVFERFLLAVTILMIPVMLLAKPLVIYLRRKPESELPKSEGEEEFNELEEEKMEKVMES